VSFDIFIVPASGDEAETFDRAAVERAFAPMLREPGDFTNLYHPDGRLCSAEVYVDDGPRISSVMITRPPGFAALPEFWQAIFDLLRATRTMLVWPAGEDEPNSCIANPDLIANPPPSLREDRWRLAKAASAAEIVAAISDEDR
jgi:hypothetical protein